MEEGVEVEEGEEDETSLDVTLSEAVESGLLEEGNETSHDISIIANTVAERTIFLFIS